MIDTLITTMLLALQAAGLAAFVHAWPWPKTWKAKKPLACATCMSGWGVIAVELYRIVVVGDVLTWATILTMSGAMAISVYLLSNTVIRSDPFT